MRIPLPTSPRRHALTAATVGLALTATLGVCGTTEDPATDAGKKSQEAITLTHSRGETITLDGPATRVGTTEWNTTEYAASLGVDPVAVSDVKGFTTWDDAVDLPSGTTDIGTRGEPSIDTIASSGLDVLFVTDGLEGKAVEQIEDQGTPVVVMPGGDAKDPVGSMWESVDLVAKATGTEDEAARLKKAYDAKVAETKQVVADAPGGPVAFADGYAESGQVSLRPFGEGSLLGAP